MNKASSTRRIAQVLAAALLTACGSGGESKYRAGYSDGYAEGYNTTCKIRATLVEGDWKNTEYSRGYQEGRTAGAAACVAERQKR